MTKQLCRLHCFWLQNDVLCGCVLSATHHDCKKDKVYGIDRGLDHVMKIVTIKI